MRPEHSETKTKTETKTREYETETETETSPVKAGKSNTSRYVSFFITHMR